MMNAIALHSRFVIYLAPNGILVAPPMIKKKKLVANPTILCLFVSVFTLFFAFYGYKNKLKCLRIIHVMFN
jgi:hypothetical protein